MSQELFSQVREEVEKEAVDTAKVKTLLKGIESGYNEAVDNLRVANTESKKRREKIRDELQPKIEEQEDRILKLQKENNTETLQTELDELKKYKQTVLKQNKENFITKFSTITQHDNFEKAKDKFTLPEADGDGKYDVTKLDDEAIQKNCETLTFLESLDFFKTTETKKPVTDGQRFRQTETGKPVEVKNRGNLLSNIKKELEK